MKMSPTFAVFNHHVNKAGVRANIWFAKKYGKAAYARHIKPLHKAGIMKVFNEPPNKYTEAWVQRVTELVNSTS